MIIIFGLAGSGKSTQGQLLAEKKHWKWLSVGEIIRNTGKFEKETKAGALIDDNVVIELMKNAIKEAKKISENIVFDGFPRDEAQALWVADNLASDITDAIYLEVPKDELFARLKLRGRSDDQDEETIKKRFAVVEQNIYAILSILKEKGITVKNVDGTGSIEEVASRLESVLE